MQLRWNVELRHNSYTRLAEEEFTALLFTISGVEPFCDGLSRQPNRGAIRQH